MEPEFDPDDWDDDEEDEEDWPEFVSVYFALDWPVDMETVEYWTTLKHLEVVSAGTETWVSWFNEPDPVEQVDWATRIGRMCWDRPWDAAWEYVEWEVKRRLRTKT